MVMSSLATSSRTLSRTASTMAVRSSASTPSSTSEEATSTAIVESGAPALPASMGVQVDAPGSLVLPSAHNSQCGAPIPE